MQFSANMLTNNGIAHPPAGLAPPPPGKSWIHHYILMSRGEEEKNNRLALLWDVLDPPQSPLTTNTFLCIRAPTYNYQISLHVVTVILISGSKSRLSSKDSIQNDVCVERNEQTSYNRISTSEANLANLVNRGNYSYHRL